MARRVETKPDQVLLVSASVRHDFVRFLGMAFGNGRRGWSRILKAIRGYIYELIDREYTYPHNSSKALSAETFEKRERIFVWRCAFDDER